MYSDTLNTIDSTKNIIESSINNPSKEKTLSIIELIISGGIGGNIIMGTLMLLSI